MNLTNNIKINLVLMLCFLFTLGAKGQTVDNITLQSDNYITLDNSSFPEKVSWTGFSETKPNVAQFPVTTYWFTHNGKAHIVIHLKNDRSQIFMELSRNKKIYQFPKDINYSPSNDADYHFNDFHLYVTDQSGVTRKFAFGKKAHITIHVEQLDPALLKINFEGTIGCYFHPQKWENGPLSAPIKISGKFSLSKKVTSPDHLEDNYSGCDNNIYNEVSPNWRLGQFRSATQCEESFYKKVYAALNEALKPLTIYFKLQGWSVSQSSYHPLDVRLKKANTNFFVTHQFPMDVDYSLTANANPAKGPYEAYLKRYEQSMQDAASMFKNGHLDTTVARRQSQLAEEGKEFGLNLKVYINRPLKTEKYFSNDAGDIPLGNLNGVAYLIKKVISNNLQQATYYDTYVLIGNWQKPRWNNDHAIAVDINSPANSKELSIQSFYIDLDCGKKLAETILKHLNFDSLHQLLKVTP